MVPCLPALLACALLAPPAPQKQEPKPAAPAAPVYPAAKPYKLNWRIEGELVLPDIDGKERTLFAESKDKVVVLVFWSYRDPVSLFYAKKLAEIQAQYADKLALYLVDSNADEIVGAGDPLARMRDVLKKENVTLPVLIDRENLIADDFEAKTNAQAFLIDPNQILRYHGGIDDDPRGQRHSQGVAVQQQLTLALDTVLRGERPEYDWTIPAGRPLKRAPKAPKR